MKKLAITSPQKIEIIDTEQPHAIGEWVLVKVIYAALCAEYKMFNEGVYNEFFGHEGVGEGVEVSERGNVNIGDRVVVPPLFSCGKCALCQSGDYIHCQNSPDVIDSNYVQNLTNQKEGTAVFAQYLLKPNRLLFKIPNDISYEHAAMANCALGPTFGALNTMDACAYHTVMITGLGSVGLGGIINAKFLGMKVIGIDLIPYRIDLAKKLGADWVFNADDPDILEKIQNVNDGVGPDMALECSGIISAQKMCINSIRRLGQVSFIGGSLIDTPIRITPELVIKGIKLIGAWHFNTNLISRMFEVIRNSTCKLDNLITNVFPMSRSQEAFELSASPNHGKILLSPWE